MSLMYYFTGVSQILPLVLESTRSGITILNPGVIENINDERVYIFYQSQTIIIKLNQEISTTKIKPKIQAFNQNNLYEFNEAGLAFIAINMHMVPGEYPLCLEPRCDDNDRKNELRIRILKTEYIKSRIASPIRRSTAVATNQRGPINRAFTLNRLQTDLTNNKAFINPIDRPRDVIDFFGPIYENNPYIFHSGVDLRTPTGTPVKAINRGKVILVGRNYRREGNFVLIAHGITGQNIVSGYLHLSRFGQVEVTSKNKRGQIVRGTRTLTSGDIVERGQIIGYSGTTGAGAKDDPHLHFLISIDETRVDPLFFIDETSQHLDR